MTNLSTIRKSYNVLSSPIDSVTWKEAIGLIHHWSSSFESKYVCICNAHSVVTAKMDPEFAKVLNESDMSTPDGMPVAWMIRRLGNKDQQRINGPDLMWKYLEFASDKQESIFLFGGQQSTLDILTSKIQTEFPNVKIAGAYSPPFRPLTDEEDRSIVDMINNSGAGTVWVSLGCPKQEKWMADHKGKINAVMIGVGAAFDYHAGTIKRAPLWMQNNGLEWFHRLYSEPRRLWKRYFVTNTLFIYFAAKQLLNFK